MILSRVILLDFSVCWIISINISGIIIPRKFILQLDRILGDFEGKVKIICTDTQVSLEAENFIIISKLIDGTFPDYEKVIPVSNDKLLQVEAEPFFNANITCKCFDVGF